MNLEELLEAYKNKQPEIVFEWNDSVTDAKGWVVINSLRGGAAGGGTRMRLGLTKDEVVSLAKVMEIKFSVCGPAIGGAKSGINFDPNDPRRYEVLQRWYKAAFPLLKNYYGTGGDLNVDELKDVVPITEELGLWHPQEGIVNGHFKSKKGEKINIIGQLRYGCAKLVEDKEYVPVSKHKYAVADMITGFGVAESVKHFFDLYKKENLTGKKAIIQGWGNVASAAGYYLSQNGVKIVGIIDRNGGIVNPDGFSQEQVTSLFLNKKGNALMADGMEDFATINQKIWETGADIFIPGAASRLVTQAQVDSMLANGLQVIACGANVPFIDDTIFFGPTAKYTDSKVSIIPDFIANCGMARVFAYLMQSNVEMTDDAIFQDVSEVIRKGLEEVKSHNSSLTGISTTALELALNKLNK